MPWAAQNRGCGLVERVDLDPARGSRTRTARARARPAESAALTRPQSLQQRLTSTLDPLQRPLLGQVEHRTGLLTIVLNGRGAPEISVAPLAAQRLVQDLIMRHLDPLKMRALVTVLTAGLTPRALATCACSSSCLRSPAACHTPQTTPAWRCYASSYRAAHAARRPPAQAPPTSTPTPRSARPARRHSARAPRSSVALHPGLNPPRMQSSLQTRRILPAREKSRVSPGSGEAPG